MVIPNIRRAAGSKAIESFFQGLAALGRLHPKSRPERHGVQCLRDIHYRETGYREHQLDIYRPAERTAEPLPVVFYVHGGGFRILSKETHWLMGVLFARRGYVVVNINYRLAPRYPYPSGLRDVVDAYTWTHKHIREYGGDPDRMILSGESAGGNLVTALTVALAFDRPEPFAARARSAGESPRAVIPVCGYLDVVDPARFQRQRPVSRFINDRILEVATSYVPDDPAAALASPLRVLESDEVPVSKLPAFFAPVGLRDPLEDDTRRLERALEKRSVRVEARYYPGEHHAFHAFIWRDQARQCWKDTFAFLDTIPGVEPTDLP